MFLESTYRNYNTTSGCRARGYLQNNAVFAMKLQIISGVNNIITVACISVTIVCKRVHYVSYETETTHVSSKGLTSFPGIKVYSAENNNVLKAYLYMHIIRAGVVIVSYLCCIAVCTACT